MENHKFLAKCVDNSNQQGVLTVGKIYEVIKEGSDNYKNLYYLIKADVGVLPTEFFQYRFEIVSRKEVLHVPTNNQPE